MGMASQTMAQSVDEEHSQHGDHHHAAAGHAHIAPDMMSDEAPQAPSGHPSKSCCTACTVVSPLPPTLEPIVELLVSRAVYTSVSRLDVAIAVSIDPGIPKRLG